MLTLTTPPSASRSSGRQRAGHTHTPHTTPAPDLQHEALVDEVAALLLQLGPQAPQLSLVLAQQRAVVQVFVHGGQVAHALGAVGKLQRGQRLCGRVGRGVGGHKWGGGDRDVWEIKSDEGWDCKQCAQPHPSPPTHPHPRTGKRLHRGREHGHECSLAVAAQAVLEDAGELGVAARQLTGEDGLTSRSHGAARSVPGSARR